MKVQGSARVPIHRKVTMRIYKRLNTIEVAQRAALLLQDKRGQDLIEYALLAGFVAVAAGAIFPTTLTPNISMIFSKISSTLSRA